jgi:YgiT-type zinc finger domain
MNGETCPICGSGVLKKKKITATFKVGTRLVNIPNYIVYRCSTCEEDVVDNKTWESAGKILKQKMQ